MVEISDDLHSLWVSCVSGSVDPKLVKDLKASLAMKDPWGSSAAVRASIWGRLDVLTQLVATGVKLADDVDLDGNTLLHHSAAHAQADTCSYLMKQGLKVDKANFAGDTPLHLARKLPEKRYLRLDTISVLSPATAPKPQSPNRGKSSSKLM
jgi:ankyrin repeat protein